MISSIKHKQSISWTFLNDAMAFSAKEMPKNHTDKERFAAALSCIQTGILTLLFPLKRRRSSPSPFISHRVLEAVASWILKSLLSVTERHKLETFVWILNYISRSITWSLFTLKASYLVKCLISQWSFMMFMILRLALLPCWILERPIAQQFLTNDRGTDL